jgi:hypothetical protein
MIDGADLRLRAHQRSFRKLITLDMPAARYDF